MGKASSDLFWTETTLEMTLEDMMVSFFNKQCMGVFSV